MPRQNNLHKHTLNLRAGDWDYIESLVSGQGISASLVVRNLVSKFVDAHRAQEPQADLTLGVTFND